MQTPCLNLIGITLPVALEDGLFLVSLESAVRGMVAQTMGQPRFTFGLEAAEQSLSLAAGRKRIVELFPQADRGALHGLEPQADRGGFDI